MVRFGRVVVAFLVGSVVATILAVVAHNQMVLGALVGLGATIPPDLWAATLLADFQGFAPSYGAVLAGTLLLGFLVAALLRRWIPLPPPLAYALAGAAATAVALGSMPLLLGIMPISGARSALGFALQCGAGGIGGAVFGWLARRRSV